MGPLDWVTVVLSVVVVVALLVEAGLYAARGAFWVFGWVGWRRRERYFRRLLRDVRVGGHDETRP